MNISPMHRGIRLLLLAVLWMLIHSSALAIGPADRPGFDAPPPRPQVDPADDTPILLFSCSTPDERLWFVCVLRPTYVGSCNPVNRWDPTGLDWQWNNETDDWVWVAGDGEIDYNQYPDLAPPSWAKPRRTNSRGQLMGSRVTQRNGSGYMTTAEAIKSNNPWGLNDNTISILANGVGTGRNHHWPLEIINEVANYANAHSDITTLDGLVAALQADYDAVVVRNEALRSRGMTFNMTRDRTADQARLFGNELYATALDTFFLDGDAARKAFDSGSISAKDVQAVRTLAVIMAFTSPAGAKNQAQRQMRRHVRRHADDMISPASAAAKAASRHTGYRKTFFDAFPELDGKVVVHHAVERQVLKKYPGLFTADEIHGLANLRGIPKAINPETHLSQIRLLWNKFYDANPNPTKLQVLDHVRDIDRLVGDLFSPPVRY